MKRIIFTLIILLGIGGQADYLSAQEVCTDTVYICRILKYLLIYLSKN